MRLIYADKLASDLRERWHTADKDAEKLISAVMADVVTPILASQPTVDAVPVIRCKDCKYSSPNQVYGCRINSFADDLVKRMYANDYCSYAERKED